MPLVAYFHAEHSCPPCRALPSFMPLVPCCYVARSLLSCRAKLSAKPSIAFVHAARSLLLVERSCPPSRASPSFMPLVARCHVERSRDISFLSNEQVNSVYHGIKKNTTAARDFLQAIVIFT
jgi:hypothetical protein